MQFYLKVCVYQTSIIEWHFIILCKVRILLGMVQAVRQHFSALQIHFTSYWLIHYISFHIRQVWEGPLVLDLTLLAFALLYTILALEVTSGTSRALAVGPRRETATAGKQEALMEWVTATGFMAVAGGLQVHTLITFFLHFSSPVSLALSLSC